VSIRRILVLLAICCDSAALAQAPADPNRAEAVRYIEHQLADSTFARLPCVTQHFGDCHGGVWVVGGYHLAAASSGRDTLRYTVIFDIIGIVGVSEAAPFFMPRTWADTVEIIRPKRSSKWIERIIDDNSPGERVRTTPDVVRRHFDFLPEDLQLLDSAVASRRHQ
jgi:hypothetical protein